MSLSIALALGAASMNNLAGTIAPAASGRISPAVYPTAQDYTFLWWPYGWKGVSPDGRKIEALQTGRYGLTFDPEKMDLLTLGPIASPKSYSDAVSESNDAVFALPKAYLSITVRAGGKVYRCVRGALKQDDFENFPIRKLDYGRFVQQTDVLNLEFADEAGEILKATGRFEMVAWSDRLAFIAEVTPESDFPDGLIEIAVNGKAGQSENPAGIWKGGEKRMAFTVWEPAPKIDAKGSDLKVAAEWLPTKPGPPPGPLTVTYDVARGWHQIVLTSDQWGEQQKGQNDRLERASLTLSNPTDRVRALRLFFDRESAVQGTTGVTPILRDTGGNPTGIPVQVSKMWPKAIQRDLPNYRPYVHGYTLLHLPPQSVTRLELTLAYAHWGGVATASHAQLSLIGWGGNQLWDQVAIGSWGENICYDPESGLGPAAITDVRPIMVWVNGREKQKWFWTNNVGGGDFLVYYDAKGEAQRPSRVKAAYFDAGPNLTNVTYAGITSDGCIASRVAVSTPRTNDINRAYHRIRYDVLKRTPFTRLAFYQVGADLYNPHQFNKMAWGDIGGLHEEWSPPKGGKTYSRRSVPCPGVASWFSLHNSVSLDKKGGAWANRGLIIRSWKARLGGKDVPTPHFSVYGTEHSYPSSNLELSAPPDVNELLPGDFVEAEVELVVIPRFASDYYGPNENLRTALITGENTWKPIFREAIGNHLVIETLRGTLRHTYPIVIAADKAQSVELNVTGGIGYVPITFSGLTDYRGYTLFDTVGGKETKIDQSVHGNDFWQVNFDPLHSAYSLTFNVLLDTPADKARTVKLTLKPTK